MKETYTYSRSFGPTASFSGMIIFAAGLISVYFNLTGLVLILLGAFVGFTYSGTTIDFQDRKVRFFNNLFGIIRVGKWINITNTMKIGMKRSNKNYRTYSLSNRKLDINMKELEIILLDAGGNPLMKLKEIKNKEKCQEEMEDLSSRLGLEIYRNKMK